MPGTWEAHRDKKTASFLCQTRASAAVAVLVFLPVSRELRTYPREWGPSKYPRRLVG